MKNKITWVDFTVTNLDQAINRYSAVLGEQIKIQPAQDFVPEFPLADTTSFRFNESVHDLYKQIP